jgi:hypothetical protein
MIDMLEIGGTYVRIIVQNGKRRHCMRAETEEAKGKQIRKGC